MFYKSIVQSVLLYGCETWVINQHMLHVLEGFHHWVARRISGLMPHYLPRADKWVYPPIEDALSAASLFSIQHYISVQQNTLAESVAL